MRAVTRRSIKKAVEKGAEVRGIETEQELHEFHRIYLDTSTRRGFNPLPYRLFKELWTQLEPRGLVKFFIVFWRKRPIAGILNTFYQEQSVPYVACSLSRFWNLHPNHLLFWRSIEWSKEVAGSSILNIWHLPQKKDQTESVDYYTFKTSFGGILIEECAFYHKIVSRTRFKIFQLLNSSLPRMPKWFNPQSAQNVL
jgi:lipid II:glycine glycyltransferase (peptidoglycan interpeptide bridge formation enzyme)